MSRLVRRVKVISNELGEVMTAPALVLVSKSGNDPHVVSVSRQLCDGMRRLKPDIPTSFAAIDGGSQGIADVVGALSEAGVVECVITSLGFHNAIDNDPEVNALTARCAGDFPEIRFLASRPLGSESSLLQVLDSRMRSALSHVHALELDGLVLSAERSGDVRGNALLARRARQWSAHHRLPCLTAVADDSGSSVAQAIMSLRSQGRRHIAVGSLFLAADSIYNTQRESAYRYGAISVSEPIGAAREVLDLIFSRYAFAAFDLLDFGFEDIVENAPATHLQLVASA
jgi:sirohydrochlorin ferrochelatase